MVLGPSELPIIGKDTHSPHEVVKLYWSSLVFDWVCRVAIVTFGTSYHPGCRGTRFTAYNNTFELLMGRNGDARELCDSGTRKYDLAGEGVHWGLRLLRAEVGRSRSQ